VKTDEIQQEPLWTKTPVANLVRYEPSGVYFVRAKVGGKLIRKSLETNVLSIAKLRLSDLLKSEHQKSERKSSVDLGKLTFADAREIFTKRMDDDSNIKRSTKRYQRELFVAIRKSWPDLDATDVKRISKARCLEWRAAFGKGYSGTRINGAISVLRRVLEIAVEKGILYDNPARGLPRSKVRQKNLQLPEPAQFEAFTHSIATAGGSSSRDCAALVSFLAFGGFRVGEAKRITWADCNFENEEITVRGDPESMFQWRQNHHPPFPISGDNEPQSSIAGQHVGPVCEEK